MPTLLQPLMIVTDLDGSLLDHHSYRWDAAVDWLDQLQQHQIPLVICTSKTAAEILPLQKNWAFLARLLLLKMARWYS